MRDKLRALGIDVRVSHGETKTICPKCSHTRKNKHEKCLSVNVTEGMWNCHHCEYSGKIKEEMKQYIKPQPAEIKLSEKIVDWFSKRGISLYTLQVFKISESVQFMPQVGGERRVINFNYFYNGELINVKYRDGEKNFKLVQGAQLLPYGIDNVLTSDTITIVEGEIDALSFFEAGIHNAISVPNGASKGSQKLEWLEEWYHVFEGKTIYLATDNDEPGIALRNELARRLGKQNCYIVTLPEKDANDTLLKHGSQAIIDAYTAAVPIPIEGIEDANSVDLLELYEQGVPEGVGVGYDMDHEFRWVEGQVTVVTGIPGHGKSTFLKNIMSRLSEKHGWRFFIYSAEEGSTQLALADMLQIHTGKSFFSGLNRITKPEIEQIKPYLAEHFKYYKLSENDMTIKGIISKAEEMVKKFGINGFVIDNMSTVERGLPKQGDTRHHSVGEMMNDLVKFARNFGVHVFLVAHPKKMSKISGKQDIPTGYDVSDSSHYFNLPDNGLTVYRNYETGQTELHRWKVRFKYNGQLGVSYFQFNINNSRYSSTQKLNDGTQAFKGQPLDKWIAAGTEET